MNEDDDQPIHFMSRPPNFSAIMKATMDQYMDAINEQIESPSMYFQYLASQPMSPPVKKTLRRRIKWFVELRKQRMMARIHRRLFGNGFYCDCDY